MRGAHAAWRLASGCASICIASLTLHSARSQTFVQQGNKLVGSGATPSSEFGGHIAISADGNTALMGGNDAVWIFTRDSNGVWTEESKLTGIKASSLAISADGKTVLIGERSDTTASARFSFTHARLLFSSGV